MNIARTILARVISLSRGLAPTGERRGFQCDYTWLAPRPGQPFPPWVDYAALLREIDTLSEKFVRKQ